MPSPRRRPANSRLRQARRALRLLLRAATIAIATVMFSSVMAIFPNPHQTARIPSLTAPASIGWDRDGIPRIHAATVTGAATATGYIHARDRFFQMEMMRRAASGRLAEAVGAQALPADKLMRTLGLRRRAEAELAALPPPVRAALQAYADGVNAYLAQHGRFTALETLAMPAPEPWTPADSLLWGKVMALYLSGNWRTEAARQSLAATLPHATIEQLWPQTINPPADAALPAPRFAAAIATPDFPLPFTLPGQASNEWAVDAAHSTTGAPLLAGDPHLGFPMPGFWYLARIETPDGVWAGATSPGIPFMVLGHNAHIAWTFTTTGADTQDLFIETPVGANQYQTPDGPADFITHAETIHVRGGADVTLTVRETRHGPVISDLAGDPNAPVTALAWTALQPGDTAAAGLYALNAAGDTEAAINAAAQITEPAQNLLIADRHHIALAVTGRVPVRRAGDGRYPQQGADGAHDWLRLASGDALPRFRDPVSGHLINANEPLAGPDFPVVLSEDPFPDWRAQRIRALLASAAKLSPEDFARFQADTTSEYAEQMLPLLAQAKPKTAQAQQIAALLAGWHGEMTMDRPQPLIFNLWLKAALAAILRRNQIPQGAAVESTSFLAQVLKQDSGRWCGGECAALLADTLDASAPAWLNRYGADPARWRWGDHHIATFMHPILAKLPLLSLIGSASIAAPGDDTTIDRGTEDAAGVDFHGPGFRAVYDLANLDASRFVAVPGQSGNPLSRHAADFLRRWRDGETVTLAPSDTPPLEDASLQP